MRRVNIKLKNRNGEEIIYKDIDTVELSDEKDVGHTFTLGEKSALEVRPDFSLGDQVIEAPVKEIYSKVTIFRPEALIPANIMEGVEIAGVVGKAGGGSGSGNDYNIGKYLVKVIDYDGTVLKQSWLNTNDKFELPQQPAHENLVFQNWSSPVEITNNLVTVDNNDIIIGATYTTKSGRLEIDITLTKATGLTVTLNTKGVKDWGDGVSDHYSSTHTYSKPGKYTIQVYFFFDPGQVFSIPTGVFGQSEDTPNFYVTGVRLSKFFTTIETQAFANCQSLQTIVLPQTVTSIESGAFLNCYSLESIVIPLGITSISDKVVANCPRTTNIVIPSGVTSVGEWSFSYTAISAISLPKGLTSLGQGVFGGNYSLRKVVIPEGVTEIPLQFSYDCMLSTIVIPEGVTTIGQSAFINNLVKEVVMPSSITHIGSQILDFCLDLVIWDFSASKSIPTLDWTKFYGTPNSLLQIIVPSNLIEEWKAATNWVNFSKYIVSVEDRV